MALKLNDLNATLPIVDGQGKPTTGFQLWWQNFRKQIEESVNRISDIVQQIVDILVALGVAQETADGALELAESAINPDGTIKTDKVLTSSITGDAVTERYLAQSIGSVLLPDGVETDVVSLNVTKVITSSEMDIDASIRLSSSDDIRGTMKVYRGADLVDSFDPFMNGAGGTYRTVLTLPYTETDIPAGPYTYKMTFTRNGGGSSLSALAGSLLRIKEIKR